jgi:pyruvate dehydrogenase E2 component (dihydrolipoamide acetyltransferase)
MHEVIMPKLGLMMEAGTIGRWLKKEGDPVRAGEALLEVESDKTTVEVEAVHTGTLLRILHPAGTEVPVTGVIGWIGEPGEQVPAQGGGPPAQPAAAEARPAVRVQAPASAPDGRVKITGVARRLALEKGVDIGSVKGSGPGGRIVLQDIENAAAAAAADAPEAIPGPAVPAAPRAPRVRSSEPLKGIRKVIAERLTASVRTIPQVTLTAVVDAGPLVALKQRLQAGAADPAAVRPTLTDLLVMAAARTLSEQPAVNASLLDDRHVVYEEVNIGLATDTPRGLLVPTIYAADRKTLAEIARARKEVLGRIQASRQTPEDLANGTFTISNLGMFGIRHFTAIINPPQGAILAVGEIYDAPLLTGERIRAGAQMQVSLVVDHRILDGADAARFLARLRELLQDPEWMAGD